MKVPRSLRVVPLLASLALAACQSSSGHAKAESMAKDMDVLRAAVVSAKEKLVAASTSLSAVVAKKAEDPGPSFNQYKKDVKGAESAVAKMVSQLETVQKKGQEYFAAWEKEAATITDPDLKEVAVERRTKLSEAVEKVKASLGAAKAEVDPYMIGLKDMQTFLGNDLTPAGISSVEDKAKRISKSSESVGEKLDDVLETLEKNAPEFKTAKPPPEA